MMIPKFSIKPITLQPKDKKEIKIDVSEGETSFATMVSVDYVESSPDGKPNHEWKETEIRFHAEPNQFLYIALACFDTDAEGNPRFYFYNYQTDGPLISVHYIQNQVWKKFKSGFFPPGTMMIRFEFEMPRNKADDKLILWVKDVDGTEHDIDPLVGNDPPAP